MWEWGAIDLEYLQNRQARVKANRKLDGDRLKNYMKLLVSLSDL